MAILTKSRAGPFFASTQPGCGSWYEDITANKIDSFSSRARHWSSKQGHRTCAGSEDAAGVRGPDGVLLHELLGHGLAEDEDVRPIAEQHPEGVVGEPARRQVRGHHVLDGLEVGRRPVELLLDDALGAVRVGRGEQEEALEVLAVAGELEHALRPEDVGLEGDADLLAEPRGRAIVEYQVHVLAQARVVRVAQAQPVDAQVAV